MSFMHDRVSHVQLSVAAFRRSFAGVCTVAGTLIAAVILTTASPAQAQFTSANEQTPTAAKDSTLSVDLTQFKVTHDEQGQEKLSSAASVKPGDIIEYKAVYKNNSNKAVSGLMANLPIPEGMEYMPKSAKPNAQSFTVAAKDGQYGVEPLQRKVMGKKDEPVPYSEYRALRWQLGQLPAGGVTAVSARAKVETATSLVPTTTPSVSR
jgi:uncharacterized repeat protein (TIGR01451 family)